MSSKTDTTNSVEMHQVVGAILKNITKAREISDRYSIYVGEEYRPKLIDEGSIENENQLISYSVPRAEISDVNVNLKFAIDKVEEVKDTDEANQFFFNTIIEKYTNLLTNEYFNVAQKILILSPKDLLFYRESIRKSIIDWLENNFECEFKNKEIVITEHKAIVIKERTDSKQDIIKEGLIEMLTLELIKIIENKCQIFIEQKLNQAEQKYSQAKIRIGRQFNPDDFLQNMKKSKQKIGWYSRSSDGYFTRQDTKTNKRLEQKLNEIVTYHRAGSLDGLKINGRNFGYHHAKDKSLKLYSDEYINRIEYSPNVYYKYHKYKDKYRTLHYIKFITNRGRYLEGGLRKNPLKTLNDIRLFYIAEGRYKDNLTVNLTLNYISDYTKKVAEAKHEFIEKNTSEEKNQFDIEINAIKNQLSYREVVNQQFSEDMDQSQSYKEAIKKQFLDNTAVNESAKNISNEKMSFKKDDQLMIQVELEELKKRERVSEINFKTNIKNHKWLRGEKGMFNLIPEE